MVLGPERVGAHRRKYRKDPHDIAGFASYCRALARAGNRTELVRVAEAADFTMFDKLRPIRMHDLSALERTIFAEVCGESCQSPEAMAQLSRTVRYLIENDIGGAFVECGVFQGASIVAMIRVLQSLGVEDRDIWLYDTFEGMPKPEAIDRFYLEPEGASLAFWENAKRNDGGSDWVRAELADVQSNVMRCGYPPARLHFVKGMVENTIPANAPERIALLRLDTDFYSSTKHELLHLYPRVVSGGVVMIDDYGAYRGAREAVDEYLKENGLRILLSRIDEHVRLFVKP